jgi:hypothetical protein
MKFVPIVYDLVETIATVLTAVHEGTVQGIRRGAIKKFDAVRVVA